MTCRLATWPGGARAVRPILSGLFAAIGVWTCVAFAAANARGVDFSPVNGTFQTFNPVRRLALGQHVGRDFDAYLGLGPTYLTRAASFLYGADYRAVLEASHLVAALSFWLTLAVLGRLCALSTLAASALATFATALATHSQPAWIGDAPWRAWLDRTWPLVAPDNSLLGLRALAPALAVLVLAGARRWLRVGEPGLERRTALAVGATAGAAAVWSNDYGISTAALLIVMAWCASWRARRGGSARFALWSCGSALLSAALVVTLVTAGSPLRWFEYNVLGVARDQPWYFAAPGASPIDWGIVLSGLAAALVLLAKACSSNARPTDPGLAFLVAATLAGGLVPSLAHADPRYFYPLERALVLVVPYLAFEGVRLVGARLRAGPRTAPERAPARPDRGVASVLYTAAALASPLVLVAPHLASAHGSPGDEPVHAAELGGDGPGYLAKMAVLGRELRAQAEAAGVPRERRLFSTYASALELFADAVQPTGDDYVIHALGPARRAAYVRTFVELEPLWVSTLRAERVAWEPWVRGVNWELYRELLARYEPFEQTVFHTLWRRRTAPLAPCTAVVEVDVRAAGSDAGRSGIPVELRFPRQAGWTEGEVLLVELELEYEVTEQRPWPFAGTPVLERPFLSGAAACVGLPPYETVRRVPIAVRSGEALTSYLRLRPEGAASIRVRAARARPWGRYDELLQPRLERLLPADVYSGGWRNGVAGPKRGAGLLVNDADDLRGIAAGAELRFAGSGARRVREVAGREVRVEGPPLDPARDGFPHWVEIVRR